MTQKIVKIIGPPGTGKTRRLVELFAEKPANSLFLTFTRAARAEIESRVPGAEARTVHSACWRALKLGRDWIISSRDLKRFGRLTGVELGGGSDPWADMDEAGWSAPTSADHMLMLNHVGRHRKETLKQAMAGAPQDIEYRWAKWFTLAYRSWKTAEGKADYTDLLEMYLDHGPVLDHERVFVDEAQDLSLLQWDVVRKMTSNAREVYLAGDDDQAIFSWAGASAAAFAAAPASAAVVLAQSWRVPERVHGVAMRIAGRITSRLEKSYRPRAGNSGGVFFGGDATSMLPSIGTTLILFRNHFRAGGLAQDLIKAHVPFTGVRSPLTDKIVLAFEAWDDIAKQGATNAARASALIDAAPGVVLADKAMRAVSAAKSGGPVVAHDLIAEKIRMTWDNHPIEELTLRAATSRDACAMLRAHGLNELRRPRVRLCSIHQAKGAEADHVVLDDELAKKTWDANLRDPDDEHRVWYVGVTRAKESLHVLESPAPMTYKV